MVGLCQHWLVYANTTRNRKQEMSLNMRNLIKADREKINSKEAYDLLGFSAEYKIGIYWISSIYLLLDFFY